jgi:hypothetical protein
LTHGTATAYSDKNIDFFPMSNVIERFDHLSTLGIGTEVFIEFTIVYRNLAGSRSDANAGYGSFAASGAEAITANLVFLYEHI